MPRRSPKTQRELRLAGLAIGFGLLLLPLLVYLAGLLTLGPYDGGLLRFLGSLYGACLRLEISAWLLVLGPWLLLTLLRLTTRPLRRR